MSTQSMRVPAPVPPSARAAPQALSSWVVGAAVLAPVVLIGGWMLAGSQQPAGYTPIRYTISDLAATTTHDRFIMTDALIAFGVLQILVALGLNRVRVLARLMLAAGGVGVLLVAALPLPGGGDNHTRAAFLAFGALTFWVPLAISRHPRAPALLRPRWSVPAFVVFLMLLIWLEQLFQGGAITGLVERVLAALLALWPLAVVISIKLSSPASHPRR